MLTAADPDAPQPERDAARLVVRRPAAGGRIDFDDPMFGDYYWVAMLDPVELADGDRFWPERAEPPPVAIDDARDVVHHGRSAVEAVLRPTASYQPRCPCRALLLSPAVVEASMARLDVRRGMVLPETFRVRLDGATGICVLVEELDGSRPGSGHDMAIEAVDEPMGDEMFRTRRAARRARARRPPLPRGR